MAKKTDDTCCEADWEHDTAYKLVDLYVRELIQQREKKILDIEGLVEAYLYVLGRLKVSEHEMDNIVEAIKRDIEESPETPEATGMDVAMGGKKLNAGLLKALGGE